MLFNPENRGLLMDKPIWVVVANSSMARVLQFNPAKPERWTEKECLTHPQSRQQGSGAGHEPAGHSIAGRSGLAPRSDPREHERHEFAQQIAHTVKAAVGPGQIGSLVVFASNPFLGQLLGQLEEAAPKSVSASHPLDLTGLPLPDLAQRLHAEFGF
jgi:protein required for attachment to host cells